MDADPSFTPLVATPCFPGYPSAHATLSNAAREVLERLYSGRRRSLVLSSPAVPGITLRYSKLKEITEDIDDARVYGGFISASTRRPALIWAGASVSICTRTASVPSGRVARIVRQLEGESWKRTEEEA